MHNNKKLILFDFDGVLVDTLIMCHEISKEVNKDLPLSEFRDLFNGNIIDSVQNNPKAKQHPQFFERYEEQMRELTIPDSIKDSISKLSKKYILTIVSATPTGLIKEILKQTNTLKYFSDALGRDIHTSKVVKNKMLLEKYNIAPENALFITDTAGDVYEARECKIPSIAVTWGYQEEESLQKANPAKIISNPDDLIKAIEE